MDRVKPRIVFLVQFFLLALGLIVGLAIGPVRIPFSESIFLLADKLPGLEISGLSSSFRTIIFDLRLPRLLTGLAVGSSLATSGAVMQGIFRNPLATPYVLGVASGGSAGAATVVVLGLEPRFALPLGALVGAVLAVGLVYRISWRRGSTSSYTLILAGVALSSLFSAITTALIFVAGPYQQHRVLFWMMGGLWRSNWGLFRIIFPVIVVGIATVFAWGRDLNALALGESAASHLGVRPGTVKKILLGIATAITAVSVSAAGSIGFVGLVVPHVMRIILGPDHRILLPASALAGGIFLIYTDLLAKTLMQPVEIPVGVITAFFGAPFFIYLLRKKVAGGRIR